MSLNLLSLIRVHITLLEFFFPATVYRVSTKSGYINVKMYSTYMYVMVSGKLWNLQLLGCYSSGVWLTRRVWPQSGQMSLKDKKKIYSQFGFLLVYAKETCVGALIRKKEVNWWYTHFFVWPFIENFSFCGHFPCGLKFCRCTKRKPMITFLKFHKL